MFLEINLGAYFPYAHVYPENGGADCNAVTLRAKFCESGKDDECIPVTLPRITVLVTEPPPPAGHPTLSACGVSLVALISCGTLRPGER